MNLNISPDHMWGIPTASPNMKLDAGVKAQRLTSRSNRKQFISGNQNIVFNTVSILFAYVFSPVGYNYISFLHKTTIFCILMY